MRARQSFEAFSAAFFIVVDFVGVYCGMLVSYWLYEIIRGKPPQSFQEIARLAVVPAAITCAAFVATAVYRCQPGPMGLEQLRRLLSAYFWSSMVTLALTFLVKAQDYPRLLVTSGFLLGLVLLLIGRGVLQRLLRPVQRKLELNRRVLILGGGRVGCTLARNLINSPGVAEIVGFLDDQSPELKHVVVRVGERDFRFPVLGKLAELQEVCRQTRANEVIVALPGAAHSIHNDLLQRSQEIGIHFSIVPSALDLMLTGAQSYSIGRIPLFRIGPNPTFILSPAIKRLFDFVGALLIGLLSSPIWLVSAMAVRLTSKGPALFVHDRVGKDGKLFKLYKFRSMYLEADPYAVTPKNHRDPRITPVGAFIRRASIDEIPQILNVLKGDMSLVGPRPEMPFIVDTYDTTQRLRLVVKPGLTGVWQISADRANPIHENLDYDLYYLENQSIWLDMAILIKTFTSVAKGVGAY